MLEHLLTALKNNPLLSTAIGLGGAGVITFWIKDCPMTIYRLLRRELTTELVITNQNKTYYDILRWIEKSYKEKNFRKLKVTNGHWGDDEAVTSIGYGVHTIKYKGRRLLLNLFKDSGNQSERDKESLTITKFGRSRELFDEFIQEVKELDVDTTKIKLYKMDNSWYYIKDQQKRPMESVFIEQEKKKLLLDRLDSFIGSEQWYLDKGIPYQLGILLYGPPGTGKTSLIKAIASYLNYPIYYLSPQKLAKIEDAMGSLSDKCLIVVEDIDSNCLTHSRERLKEDMPIPMAEIMGEDSTTSLSEVLNALDGVFSAHGRILIATTNHIEKLDKALVRPGRIDLQVEVGYVNNEILQSFINNFFPEKHINCSKINIKPEVTVAMLQNMVLQNMSAEQIIKEISHRHIGVNLKCQVTSAGEETLRHLAL